MAGLDVTNARIGERWRVGEVELEVRRDDEHVTADLLRSGEVMAAVTTEPRPVQGCSVRRLGAMAYRAKAAGRGRAEIFDDALRREIEERAALEAAITRGLQAGEFLLHYQPVVDLATYAVLSAVVLTVSAATVVATAVGHQRSWMTSRSSRS